jgi:hypothetical protein
MDERRDDDLSTPTTQARVTYRLPVTVEGDDAEGTPFTERTMAENVTRRGAFVETGRTLTPGSLLALHDASDYASRLCYVQVVWVRENDGGRPGVGVKLVSGNERWMEYLLAHSVQELEDEEPPVE